MIFNPNELYRQNEVSLNSGRTIFIKDEKFVYYRDATYSMDVCKIYL